MGLVRKEHFGRMVDKWLGVIFYDEVELAAWFPRVTLQRQEEALLVTETQPLIDYVLSVRQQGHQ